MLIALSTISLVNHLQLLSGNKMIKFKKTQKLLISEFFGYRQINLKILYSTLFIKLSIKISKDLITK